MQSEFYKARKKDIDEEEFQWFKKRNIPNEFYVYSFEVRNKIRYKILNVGGIYDTFSNTFDKNSHVGLALTYQAVSIDDVLKETVF